MKRSLTILLVLSLFLVSTMTVFGVEGTVDVALYQPSLSSSVCDENHPSDLANDGINDNEAYTWWMSASSDTSAWWQVDLGLGYKISAISLEAKFGSADAERRNIKITGSATADFQKTVELAVIGSEGYTDEFSAEISKKDLLRYIKVEKTDAAPLSIGEFSVYTNKSEILQGADAISLSGQIPATDEAGRYVIPQDVIGTRYEKAVGLLSSLNIMRGYPDGDFIPEDSITRAEFATVVTRLLGNNYSKHSKRSFVDVAKEHWAYNSIETASALGIVNGVDEGIFLPDNHITTPQVVKMLVCTLGYKDLAETSGGYPDGYMNVAKDLDLFKNLDLDDEIIRRGEIAVLVYNALECDVMKLHTIGEYKESIAYDGQTVLSEYLKLKKGKGIVNAVRGTSLTDVNKKKDENYIEIDGISCYADIPNLDAYLGYSVEYYYEAEDTLYPQIVAIVVLPKNNVLSIDAKDLVKIEDNVLIYGQEAEEEANLSKDMDVLYNGVARRVYDYEDLLPKSGSVKLIDNDDDYEYDVYIVSAIKNYVVSWVNTNKHTVYAKDGAGSLCLDPELARVSVTHKATGENISLEMINEWNILSAMESVNESGEKSYEVIVSDEFIRGSLELKAKDYVVVAGRELKVAENFDIDALELGAKGYFYLDAVDKIAAFNGDITPGEQYGFLRDAQYETGGVDNQLKFRIFTKEGKFETIIASEKFTLDGAYVEDKSTVEKTLKATGLKDTEAQVIQYVVNASGFVTSMNTTQGSLNLNYSPEDGIGTPPRSDSGYYLNAAEVFDALFAYDAKTLMMKLPATGELSSEKDYKLLPSSDLSKTEYYNSLKVYDVDEHNIAGMILFTSGGGQSAGGSYNLFLADSLTLALDENGDVLYNVTGIYNGAEKSYFIDENVNVVAEDFERGSVLTLSFTGNVITNYEVKLFKDAKPEEAPELSVSVLPEECQDTISPTGIMGKCFLGYGTVVAKKDGIITVQFAGNGGEEGATYEHLLVRTSSLGRIYRFDEENDEVYVSNANEILDAQTVGTDAASKVLLTADSGNMRQLIILN